MMKKFLTILVVLLVAQSGFGQNRKDKKLLSSSFIENDSLVIQIMYNERPNCVEIEFGFLVISINNGNVNVNHQLPKTHEFESFNIKKTDVFKYIIEFEDKGKKIEPCGGYVGGSGVEVKFSINGSKTEFFYCKDTWDGIKELLLKIKNKK